MDDLKKWHKQVFQTLNPDKLYEPPANESVLHTESVFSEHTKIPTPSGNVNIKAVFPGDWILDEYGNHIRVNGIVQVDSTEVKNAVYLGGNSYMSSSVWVQTKTEWRQPNSKVEPPLSGSKWYSLFTESGEFVVHTEEGLKIVRDFTDVGPERIQETYDWVLESLRTA